MKNTCRLLSLVLCLLMLVSCCSAFADALEMSDIPGMTAPGVLPIVTEPVTLSIGLTHQSNVEDYDTNDFTVYMEELTGIDIEFYFLPSDETKNKVDLIAPVYNEEETEIVNEVSSMIWETSNEWRTLFVTGGKDIDADWDAYLAELDALGLAEYTAASQSCYDRMNNK